MSLVLKAELYYHNFLNKLLGLIILAATIFLGISLASFDAADPSLNHITNHHIHNLGGYYGALIADFMWQSLGGSSIFIILFLSTLGIKLVGGHPLHFVYLRILVLTIFLPVFATACAFLNNIVKNTYFYPGGVLGTYIKDQLTAHFHHTNVLMTSFLLSLVGVMITSNLSPREWKNLIIMICKVLEYMLKFSSWAILSLYALIERKKEDLSQNTIEQSSSDVVTKIKSKMPKFEPYKQIFTKAKNHDDHFQLPPTTLLKEISLSNKKNQVSESALNQNAKLLFQVLQDFGVNGNISNIRPGPVVTLYELEPAAGTKSSRVIGLSDDIARSMSAVSARISVIAGKNALGIELPNAHREIVLLRELMESAAYVDSACILPLVLGKNIGGGPVIADLAKMPHLLVAGTTGSGKSVAINTMVLSLLYKLSPKECQFIMIDPKMLELSVYEGIPHLLTPVVTEPKKAVIALKWVVKEMEQRYRAMSILGVRNIQGFNKAIEEATLKGQRLEKQVQTGFDKTTGDPIFEPVQMPEEKLPYIVVIVDEMADLMLVAGKDIEGYIQRLAQMARAAGIHIIMATQRPSVDVITGVIKANFPTRISFQVTSKIDSRTILGEQGAEQLLGMGDMLHMMGGGRIERVHGPFVGDKEVEMVVAFLKQQGSPKYKEEVTLDDDDEENNSTSGMDEGDGDDLYSKAVAIVIKDRRPTTSYLQRCLRIGYNKSASLIERMEKEGVLSAPNHTGKREILVEE